MERKDLGRNTENRGGDGNQVAPLILAPAGQDSLPVACHLSPITPSPLYPCHLPKTAAATRPLFAAPGGNDPEPNSPDRLVRDLALVADLPVRDAQHSPQPSDKKDDSSWRESTRTAREGRLDIDRRRAPRAHLELPVRITWRDAGGHRLETQGWTRDFSKTGIYFTAPVEINTMNALELKVNFPEDVAARTGLEGLYLTRSVRMEELDASVGSTDSAVGMAARFTPVHRAAELAKAPTTFTPKSQAAAAYLKWGRTAARD